MRQAVLSVLLPAAATLWDRHSAAAALSVLSPFIFSLGSASWLIDLGTSLKPPGKKKGEEEGERVEQQGTLGEVATSGARPCHVHPEILDRGCCRGQEPCFTV